jgi:Leucine-rich repeat (LRR) protein
MKKYLPFLFLMLLFTDAFAQTLNYSQRRDSLVRVWHAEQQANAVIIRKNFLKTLQTANKDSVFSLDLSRCYFSKMPDIAAFRHIKIIQASYNSLKKVPASQLKSDSLHKVIFSFNQLKKIRFPKNTSITSVVLDRNKFKRIPRSMRRLKNLKTLDLNHNHIKRVPRFLRRMDSLEEINLSFNKIKFDTRAVKNLAGVKRILLEGDNLTKLPENIGELKAVRKLNFAKNHLSSVPQTLGNLDSLEILIFYKNDFDSIPAPVFRLHHLVELDFYYNHLTRIPPAIGRLKNLRQLYLSFNRIATLPDSMQKLTQLRYLYIHHNRLKVIPVWIKDFRRLQRLGFGFNQLFYVPRLSGIKSLKEVDLQHNNLSVFPWKLAFKPCLRSLILRNNPFILSGKEKEKLNELSKEKRAMGQTLIP